MDQTDNTAYPAFNWDVAIHFLIGVNVFLELKVTPAKGKTGQLHNFLDLKQVKIVGFSRIRRRQLQRSTTSVEDDFS